jgi:hypothetical protein
LDLAPVEVGADEEGSLDDVGSFPDIKHGGTGQEREDGGKGFLRGGEVWSGS